MEKDANGDVLSARAMRGFMALGSKGYVTHVPVLNSTGPHYAPEPQPPGRRSFRRSFQFVFAGMFLLRFVPMPQPISSTFAIRWREDVGSETSINGYTVTAEYDESFEDELNAAVSGDLTTNIIAYALM